jgi:hypothetical protein
MSFENNLKKKETKDVTIFMKERKGESRKVKIEFKLCVLIREVLIYYFI